jgi:hypothetical protein
MRQRSYVIGQWVGELVTVTGCSLDPSGNRCRVSSNTNTAQALLPHSSRPSSGGIGSRFIRF